MACKILKRDKAASADAISLFLREAVLLSQCDHPHVIGIYGVCTIAPHTAMLLEWAPGGALRDMLNNFCQDVSLHSCMKGQQTVLT